MQRLAPLALAPLAVLALTWDAALDPLPVAASSAQTLPLSEQDSVMVGEQACKKCHSDIHQTWDASRHSKMVQPATPQSVKGDFRAGNIRLDGDGYRVRFAKGKFFIRESYFTGQPQEHEVEYTLGNRRIQHYLTTLDDGRIVVLPPSWDVLRNQWFHNLDIAAPDQQQGAIPVQVWNKNCFGCHVSDEKKNYDVASRSYETEWLNFGGNCERCHGPGSRHVDRYTQRDLYDDDPSSYIVRPTKLDNVRNSMVCAQCHSFRDELVFGFSAGENYYDYFLPFLEYTQGPSEDPTWYGDGKTRRFSTNALGIWQSECFLVGKVACTSCHYDPHQPEIELNEQLASTHRSLCTGCHQELATDEAVEAHSFHPASSQGARCVECHMPKTVTSIKATMRDHSISVPAPENTVKYGIPNACGQCHEESADWAAARLDEWYPQAEGRRKILRRADAYLGARQGTPEALELLLDIIADPKEGFINRANAIGHLGHYAEIADTRLFPVLERAAGDTHPLVRAAALLRLAEAASIRPDAAKSILIAALNDPRATVRMTAAVSLLNVGVSKLEGEANDRFNEAKSLHVSRGHFYSDDAPQQLNLGRFFVLNRSPARAAAAFENSFELNPSQPGIRYFMAVTRLSQGRTEEARRLLQEIPSNDPFVDDAKGLLERFFPDN